MSDPLHHRDTCIKCTSNGAPVCAAFWSSVANSRKPSNATDKCVCGHEYHSHLLRNFTNFDRAGCAAADCGGYISLQSDGPLTQQFCVCGQPWWAHAIPDNILSTQTNQITEYRMGATVGQPITPIESAPNTAVQALYLPQALPVAGGGSSVARQPSAIPRLPDPLQAISMESAYAPRGRPAPPIEEGFIPFGHQNHLEQRNESRIRSARHHSNAKISGLNHRHGSAPNMRGPTVSIKNQTATKLKRALVICWPLPYDEDDDSSKLEVNMAQIQVIQQHLSKHGLSFEMTLSEASGSTFFEDFNTQLIEQLKGDDITFPANSGAEPAYLDAYNKCLWKVLEIGHARQSGYRKNGNWDLRPKRSLYLNVMSLGNMKITATNPIDTFQDIPLVVICPAHGPMSAPLTIENKSVDLEGAVLHYIPHPCFGRRVLKDLATKVHIFDEPNNCNSGCPRHTPIPPIDTGSGYTGWDMNWSGEGLPMDLDDELMIQSPNVTFVDPPMPRPMSLIPRSSGYIVDESGQNQNYTTDRPTLQVGSIQSGLGTRDVSLSPPPSPIKTSFAAFYGDGEGDLSEELEVDQPRNWILIPSWVKKVKEVIPEEAKFKIKTQDITTGSEEVRKFLLAEVSGTGEIPDSIKTEGGRIGLLAKGPLERTCWLDSGSVGQGPLREIVDATFDTFKRPQGALEQPVWVNSPLGPKTGLVPMTVFEPDSETLVTMEATGLLVAMMLISYGQVVDLSFWTLVVALNGRTGLCLTANEFETLDPELFEVIKPWVELEPTDAIETGSQAAILLEKYLDIDNSVNPLPDNRTPQVYNAVTSQLVSKVVFNHPSIWSTKVMEAFANGMNFKFDKEETLATITSEWAKKFPESTEFTSAKLFKMTLSQHLEDLRQLGAHLSFELDSQVAPEYAPILGLLLQIFKQRVFDYFIRPGHPKSTLEGLVREIEWKGGRKDTLLRARQFLKAATSSQLLPLRLGTDIKFNFVWTSAGNSSTDMLYFHTCSTDIDVLVGEKLRGMLLEPREEKDSEHQFDYWLHAQCYGLKKGDFNRG